jgi:hypothetical protein
MRPLEKAIYKKNPDFVSRNIAGELVLIPIRRQLQGINCIYSINETGSRMWELIDGKNSADEIRDRLCAEFEVETSTLEQDLGALFGQLREIKAILPA